MSTETTKPSRRGRPKTLTDEARRDQAVAAAMTVFIEKGFARTTTTDIASHAGMSKRDLYRLFTDKTAIFTAAILSRRHLILDLPRPQNEKLPALEALRHIFRLDLDDREAAERDALMNLVARESLLAPELNALLYDTGIIRSRELLIDWLDQQIADKALPECDSKQLAGLLMDVVFGALLPRRKPKCVIDREHQAKDILTRIAIVLAGLNHVINPEPI